MSPTTKSSNSFFTPPLGGFAVPQPTEHATRLEAARLARKSAFARRELVDVPSAGECMRDSDPAMTAAFL